MIGIRQLVIPQLQSKSTPWSRLVLAAVDGHIKGKSIFKKVFHTLLYSRKINCRLWLWAAICFTVIATLQAQMIAVSIICDDVGGDKVE